MLSLLAGLLLGYLLGSLPTAALVARWRGRDVFEVGSGNMGAMNTARNLGYGLGSLVLLLDIGKGALASYLGLIVGGVANLPDGLHLAVALAAGFGAVLGHCFSAYVGFRGGKGLATTLGVALPLYPLAGLFGLALLVALTLLLRRHSGVAAVITLLLYPALVGITLLASGRPTPIVLEVLAGVAAIAVVVLVKHLAAFRREATEPAT